MNKKNKKIGLFLGTFNPIHNGHIHIARSVISELELDKLFIIPSYDSPHKTDSVCTCTDERLEMCKLACSKLEDIFTNDIEIRNKLTGYSLKKIDLVREQYIGAKFYYIIGSDAYIKIMKWDNLREFLSKVSLCVVVREKGDLDKVKKVKADLEKINGESFICDFDALSISSTMIREKIKNKESISSFLPFDVEKYILDKNLYR